jgi:hypothetical protein
LLPPSSPNGLGDVSDASSGGTGFFFLALVLAAEALGLAPQRAGARVRQLVHLPRSRLFRLELERPG